MKYKGSTKPRGNDKLLAIFSSIWILGADVSCCCCRYASLCSLCHHGQCGSAGEGVGVPLEEIPTHLSWAMTLDPRSVSGVRGYSPFSSARIITWSGFLESCTQECLSLIVTEQVSPFPYLLVSACVYSVVAVVTCFCHLVLGHSSTAVPFAWFYHQQISIKCSFRGRSCVLYIALHPVICFAQGKVQRKGDSDEL